MRSEKTNFFNLKKSRKFKIIVLFLVLLATVCICVSLSISKILNATKAYNKKVEEYNKFSAEYSELSRLINIENIEGMVSDYGRLKIESTSAINCLRGMLSSSQWPGLMLKAPSPGTTS